MRGLRPTLLAGLNARVCDCPTPCPAAKRQGRGYAPGALAGVGAGTPLAMAYGRRLPRPFSSRLGRERRTGLRDAGRLPHASGAAPSSSALTVPSGFGCRSHAYKTACYKFCGGEGSIPRDHTESSTKRETRVRRRVEQLEARRGWVMSAPKSSCATAYTHDRRA
jgi:hypothetical protein